MLALQATGGGTFCVDTTEVTVAQYNAFLTAKNGDTAGQPTVCSWNGSFATTTSGFGCDATSNDMSHASSPVRCLDWCDAFAYCAWAGKRLCGAIGGGTIAPWEDGNVAKSQWFYACSSAGKYDFEYGTSFQRGVCADQFYADGGLTGPIPVASAMKCHSPDSPFDTIHDMVDNVSEWLDSCDSNLGMDDNCTTAGGDFSLGGACRFQMQPAHIPRQVASNTVGFRCCD